jgi:uncharacterized coiled-coil protein SlyX
MEIKEAKKRIRDLEREINDQHEKLKELSHEECRIEIAICNNQECINDLQEFIDWELQCLRSGRQSPPSVKKNPPLATGEYSSTETDSLPLFAKSIITPQFLRDLKVIPE